MQILRAVMFVFAVAAASANLAGCGSGGSQLTPAGLTTVPFHRISVPDAVQQGIYASQDTGSALPVLGYQSDNQNNNPPFCTTPFSVSAQNDVAVDNAGNLMVPESQFPGGSIYIGTGPDMCGAQAGTISDPYGTPVDASSANALTGRIAVANGLDTVRRNRGSISVCTLSGGCTHNLKNPNMYRVEAVVMDNRGNCWGSAATKTRVATLTYFARCAGKGVAATGYQNVDPGGLDIDSSGNLVSIDGGFSLSSKPQMWVYSGCTPACRLVEGPFPLVGSGAFGHLNHSSTMFAMADEQNNQIDVYSYSPTSISFLYSFSNGLPSGGVVGVAYSPRSKQ
jgi:hypothetical protein